MADMPDSVDTRSRILSAAFEQFATHGFRGATIKGIAQAAKLQSPALIYWYFPHKEALFQGVIEAHLPFVAAMADPTPLLDRQPRDVLTYLAQTYLHTFEQPLAQSIVRLLVPEAIRRPEIADLLGERVLKRVLHFLSTYLDHQVTLGRLRPHDVRSSARSFMGMLLPQALAMVVMPALRSDGPSNDEHIATVVDIFLRGLQPS